MKKAIITVVIPLYNKEKQVMKTVVSLQAQKFGAFEVVIVDDGSTDQSYRIIAGVRDKRFRVVRQANQGVSAARNRGIAEAQSDIIAFLDADDEWFPDHLETILWLRGKYSNCDAFATNYIFKESETSWRTTKLRGFPRGFADGVLDNYFATAAKGDPPLWTSATAITKQALESIGGFPVGIASGEDLLTWARLAVCYRISYTLKPTAAFCTYISQPVRPRCPQVPDVVGRCLKELLSNIDEARRKDFQRYISSWYKMRANCYLRLSCRREARHEIEKALQFAPNLPKNYIYYLLSVIPIDATRILYHR